MSAVASLAIVLSALAQPAPSEEVAPAAPRLPVYAAAGSVASSAEVLRFDRLASSATEAQVEGGEPFPKDRLPATFQAPYPDIPGEFCTATLIGPKVILTAAHCLDLKRADNTYAVRKISIRLTPASSPITATSCTISPAYLKDDHRHPVPRNAHDQALCELPLPLGVVAERVDVRPARAAVGAKLMLAGFGCTYRREPNGSLTEVPSVQLLVGLNTRSGSDLGWATMEGQVDTARVSLCRGDSGGGVYAGADPKRSQDRGWTVTAVASGVLDHGGGRIVSYLSLLSAPEFAAFLDDWRHLKNPKRLNKNRQICGPDLEDPQACRPL